jgi:hypothetical protein
MNRLTLLLVLAVAVAAGITGSGPVTATVDGAAALQAIATGDDGMATQRSGCTRITNRFCSLSTRDNCLACR